MGTTVEIAEWVANLRYEDIPGRVLDKTRAQIMSVVGAIHASRHSEAARAAADAAREWGSGEDSSVLLNGQRLPRHQAIFANCCASVAFDYDDYLFAGHTGHSAVLASLAYGEHLDLPGRDVITAMVVANEVGGRLGASLLFGPHNGQMWAYIHLLESACAVGKLIGLDADGIANAIGIAFTQPAYPLMPAFMGPDSKLLIPASTTAEGARAAELAAKGWTGARTILEDRQGFLRKYNESHLGWMLSGLGSAWVSDSLCYKVVPGCAYIDTAVDAMREITQSFADKHDRRPVGADVSDVHVKCGLYTMGMETLCNMNRAPGWLAPISVNFSVALSFGLMFEAGELGPQYLSHSYLDQHRAAIEDIASKVTIEHVPEMDRRASQTAESGGFSLRSLLSGASAQVVPELTEQLREVQKDLSDAEPPPKSLDGVSFEGYRMSFPSEVELTTVNGESYVASQDIPLGGSGRPWDETRELAADKLRRNMPPGRGDDAVAAVEAVDGTGSVRQALSLLAGGW